MPRKLSHRIAATTLALTASVGLTSCSRVQAAQILAAVGDDHHDHRGDHQLNAHVRIWADGTCAWWPEGGWTVAQVGWPTAQPVVTTIDRPAMLTDAEISITLYEDQSCGFAAISSATLIVD